MLAQSRNRIREIDALRGLAIILMVLFHIIVDLTDFFGYPFQYLSGFWYYEGKAAAILFMTLAGVSASLSRSPFRHGLKLIAWGMVLTAVTWLFMPATYIRFGILHFLGTSLLTWPLTDKQKPGTLLFLAITSMILGNFLSDITITTSWLLPLGLMPPGFSSMDYYPLLPWYGIFLIGGAAGKLFYQDYKSLWPALCPPKWLLWLGGHSLAIYLLHQPLVMAILFLLHW